MMDMVHIGLVTINLQRNEKRDMTYLATKKTAWGILHHFGFEKIGGGKRKLGWWHKVREEDENGNILRRYHALIRDKNTIELHHDITINKSRKKKIKKHRASSLGSMVKKMIEQFKEYELNTT